MSDEQLARDVSDELQWDPKVDSRAVSVLAAAGVVTLRGTVPEDALRTAVEILQQRVVDIWRLVSSIPTRFHDKTRRPVSDSDALTAIRVAGVRVSVA